MSDLADRISKLSPKRLALLALELQNRLDAAERRAREPIAIVGMACRLPGGANSPEEFWRLLRDGVDAVTEVPAERWDAWRYFDADQDAPGKMVTRWGGFIDDIDRFDAALFGISPREATTLDPQQRLLLETSWAALEDAGHAPDGLRGSRSGVFVGIGTSDYALLVSQGTGLAGVDAYRATGCISHSPAAGRISYVLGLQGPSVAIDTACSSSLVAVHLAVQSLRLDECTTALAGGVNAILLPELGLSLSKAGMMARDGRCKTFDAAADGFVRGEGCGVVVLKRLSQALADGDRVLAVIRGTASNQDGRSNGLTAPNGPAQEDVIREALVRSGLRPEEISYVETHGTGTELGDPIEVRAIGAVLGKDRPAGDRLRLGSVKTNIGHLEATAGVASLIKLVLALQHRAVPASLHFKTPNPFIPWDEFPLEVTTALTEWNPPSGRRIAGVSSFGFSGTNAHVIVEEAPTVPPRADENTRDAHVLTLSGKTAEAVRTLAARYGAFVAASDVPLADVCFTATVGRAALGHRVAIVTGSRAELVAQLEAVAAGRTAPGVVQGEVRGTSKPRVAFAFTGQGAQYPGMGRELYETQPVFRAALDACAAGLAGELERPLLDVLYGDAGALIDETAYAQPALFAVEYALAQLWASWGVDAAAVLGHSIGEYAAAVVAGALSLEEALRLVAARGRLLQGLPRTGAMTAALAPAAVVETAVAGEPGVGLAAINAADAVVVSGPAEGVAAVEGRLRAAGVEVQRLTVSHAFHSALVEPVLAAWEAAAGAVRWQSPRMTVVSGLTGRVASADELKSASYWRRQVREPVQFAAAVTTVVGAGYGAVVEVGPQPTLTTLAQRGGPGATVWWGGALRRGRSAWSGVLTGAAELWVRGVGVNWAAVAAGTGARRVALPTYPFQRTRYWIDPPAIETATTIVEGVAPATAERALDAIAPSITQVEWDAIADVSPAAEPRAERVPAAALTASLRPLARTLADRHGTAAFDAAEPAVDRLCAAYVYRALRALGWGGEAGTRFTTGELAVRLGVVPRHRRLFERLLDMLREDGVLERSGSSWGVRPHAQPDPAEPLQRDLAGRYPAWDAELTVLARCGAALAAVLRGTQDPLPLLFPAGTSSDLERIYRDSASSVVHNTLLAEAVAREVERRPAGSRVRVIEIGGGTGATTSSILPRLPADRVDYVFTDVSSFFVTQAGRTFAAAPHLRAKVLDIEALPASQGFERGSFDVAVAANVLHATRDLADTLEHVAQLVAPGGLLLLWENTRAQRWVDLVFGLTDGWWRFADPTLRPTYPLLSAGEWRVLLGEHGFDGAASLPDEAIDGGPTASPHAIVAARRGVAGAATVAGLSAQTPGRWLVLADRAGVAPALRERLVAAGDAVTLVRAAEQSERLGGDEWTVRAEVASEVDRVLREAVPADRPIKGVLNLWALDTPEPDGSGPASARAQVLSGLALVNVVNGLTAAAATRVPMWIVTRGAQAVGRAGAGDVHVEQAPFWGWGRSVRLDHPDLWGGLVDLDPAAESVALQAAQVVGALALAASEDQIAVRGEHAFVPRVRPLGGLDGAPVVLDPQASYLVSGGLGAVGLHVAAWMADRGARHLVLVGRSGLGGDDTDAARTVQSLERRGVAVTIARIDVSDPGAVVSLCSEIADAGPPLRGVVHAAGVLAPLPFAEVDRPALEAMFAPKIAGARNLHEATRAMPLDFFVLFSTSSSVTGAQGLSHYTAANQYLDALAHHRRSLGLPALAVDWGRWSVVSPMMSMARHRWLDASGMHAFSPREGLAAFEALLGGGATQAMVLRAGKDLVDRLEAHARGALLREMPVWSASAPVPETQPRTSRAASPAGPPAAAPRAEPKAEPGTMQEYVRARVAEALGMAAADLDVDEPINGLGLDSIMALQLKNRVEAERGLKVSVVHFLNGDTVAQLAAALVRQQGEIPVAEADAATAADSSGQPGLDALGARDVNELSDAEVEQLLARFLPNETR